MLQETLAVWCEPLFCYETDVAVCIAVHAYMSKEGETEREKTVNETDLCQTFCLQTITKYPTEICQISDRASSSPTWGERRQTFLPR